MNNANTIKPDGGVHVDDLSRRKTVEFIRIRSGH